MHSVLVDSLSHDSETSYGLPYPPIAIVQNSPPCHGMCNSARVHQYAHPQHSKVFNYLICIYNMNVGCSLWVFGSLGVCSLNHDTTTLFRVSHSPKFSNISSPPAQVLQCKGAPIWQSTAYQGATTLCIHII